MRRGFITAPQLWSAVVHFFEASMTAKYTSLNSESSVGKLDLFLVTFLIYLFRFSMAFVVYMMRLISSGYL